VLGELVGGCNGFGVTGVCPGADVGLGAKYVIDSSGNLRTAIANAIILAINDGNPGDVILLETQMYVCGVGAYGPSEFDQTVFDAIQTATANGFVVVEAAGNGAVNLDRAECNNKFNRIVRDSGAIIVGAGGCARRVEARERLWFSSYGDRVDMQGWGNDVCTTGYGDKFQRSRRYK
jgi:serine protease